MIKLKNLILFELFSILLLCTVIGGILYASDLSSFWRERYSRDAGVIRQAFLDHHNEIVNGDMRGFESTLATIAKVYSIKAFEVNSRILGKVVRIEHDANGGGSSKKSASLRCDKPNVRSWVTGTSACFVNDFTWNSQTLGEPLLTVTWWVSPDGLRRQRHSAVLMFLSALSLGVAFCGLHWLMLRKVIVRPVSQAVERFGTWVRKDGATPSVKSLFMPKTHEISELILHFEHLINAAEDNRSLRELAIQLESTELVAKQVSHDLRSPLSALKVSVDSMARSPSEEAKALAQRAFLRVNEILATLGQNPGRAREEPFDKSVKTENVIFLTESILSEHGSQIDRQKISLQMEHSCERELFIKADCAALKRALSNLLTNAIESLCELQGGEIILSLEEVGAKICISIRDNGRGIPAYVLNRLGEKGFSFGKENCPASGSGLGVFQAKRAIEACAGRVDYQSQLEIGTTVTVTLPLADPPASWTEQIPVAALMVVVDDDVTVHRSWREKLVGSNCQLKCFLSSNKFEAWLKTAAPDFQNTLFFFDFSLGPHEPNGFELIVRNRLPAQRVIIISGIADSLEVQIQAERFGTKLIHKRYFASKEVAALDPKQMQNLRPQAVDGPA